MSNNREFLDIYNRLDRYLQNICNVNSHINLISYYERSLPEEKRSSLRTIREFKNHIESHGVSVGGLMPVAPKTFINFLYNELDYCKKNKDIVAGKIKKLLSEKNKSSTKKELTKISNSYNNYFQNMYQYDRSSVSLRTDSTSSNSSLSAVKTTSNEINFSKAIRSTFTCKFKQLGFTFNSELFKNELKIRYSLTKSHNAINGGLILRLVFKINGKLIHQSKDFYLCDAVNELTRGFIFIEKVTSDMIFYNAISCDINFEYCYFHWDNRPYIKEHCFSIKI